MTVRANVIQFLAAGGGDGTQLALSALDRFDPAQLAVTEGTGLVLAHRALALDEETATWLGRSPQAPASAPEPIDADAPWQNVLRYVDRDESALETLVQNLVRKGIPVPVVGYELGDQMWQAELAWPAHRLAIVLSGQPDDPEIADRNRAYAAAGWQVRTAKEWTADELTQKIMATSGREER